MTQRHFALSLATAVVALSPRFALAQSSPSTTPTTPPTTPVAPQGTAGTGATDASATPAATPPNPERAEARAAFQRGNSLYDANNFESALTEYQRAYELYGTLPTRYRLFFNIARCYERLFRYNFAVEYYRRFLEAAAADDPNRVMATASMAALEGLLGTLDIRSNVPHAEVWVDDRQVSDRVQSVRIPGGVHVVELRVRGYSPARQQVSLPARTTVSLEFRLERLNVRRGLHPAFFGIVTGVGVAVGTAGIVLGARVLSIRAEVDRLLASPNREEMLMVGQDHKDAIRAFAVGADITFAFTGVAAVGATLLGVATEWRRPAENQDGTRASSLTVLPVASSTFRGLSLGGSF
ncbi:MAG: PEGA domain-containing protein [Myxococcales bacterium]|nr:PEGA domain-containing protein [Myxococcales bacterium]